MWDEDFFTKRIDSIKYAYAFYSALKINSENRRQALTAFKQAQSYFVEPFGDILLFAPSNNDAFKENNNPEDLQDCYKPAEDEFLIKSFQKYLSLTDITDIAPATAAKEFLIPRNMELSELQDKHQCYFVNPWHDGSTQDKNNAWSNFFVKEKLMAVGYSIKDYSNCSPENIYAELKEDKDLLTTVNKALTPMSNLLQIKPGDIICCMNGRHGFRGIGIAASKYQYINKKKTDKSQYYYRQSIKTAWISFEITNKDLKINQALWPWRSTLSRHHDSVPSYIINYILKTNNSDIMYNEYIPLLEANKNLILTGAPGTGKTCLAFRIAEDMGVPDKNIGFVQFHPSYDYTDFVEGLRPSGTDTNGQITFKRRDGIFKDFCKQAVRKLEEQRSSSGSEQDNEIDPSEKFVFIIDEINRGELSKIFGELFFSIDPDWRGSSHRVKTQYQNLVTEDDPFYDGFYVPNNVYIIGTMNDIDRSVDSMDFALRRRFAWLEIKASENTAMLSGCGDQKEKIINCMNRLNQAIWDEEKNDGIEGLSPAYHIGGAYFKKMELYLNQGSSPEDAFKHLWNNHLRGMLYEYVRGSFDAADKLKTLEHAYFGSSEQA